MNKLIEVILAQLKAGQDVEFVTVLDSNGPTPRGAGAHMLVNASGYLCGTIGGGKIEESSKQVALDALQAHKSTIEHFKLVPSDLGMMCGGNSQVLFTFLDHQDVLTCQLFETLQQALTAHRAAWLQQTYRAETVTLGIAGEQALGQTIDPRYLTQKPHLLQEKNSELATFVEPISHASRVFIFGAGHLAQAIVPVLKRLDFYTQVYDDRLPLLTTERFPDADELHEFDLNASFELTDVDYVLLMTRSHELDYQLQAKLLKTPALFIGGIGSKHKHRVHRARLLKSGFTETDVDRVHMPVGLSIDAESPAEIAISIAAEMIQVRAGLD
jgi:xanthine dehydrogenase accessory factor